VIASRHGWGTGGRAAMRLAVIGGVASLALAVSACGSTTTTTNSVGSGVVTVAVTAPTSGTVIAGNNVTIRGTVTPTNATVLVQGKPAAVGNGVFTAEATLHAGKTTVDVIGSAPGATPGSTSVSVTQQSSGGSGGSSHKSSPGGGSSGGGSSGGGVAHEVAPSSGGGGETSCGGDLSVGPATTCEFAEDVQSAYRSSGGASTVEAYSPVTNKTYEMTCVTGVRVKCTGGIGASVYFSP
jgi:hypothetical protein